MIKRVVDLHVYFYYINNLDNVTCFFLYYHLQHKMLLLIYLHQLLTEMEGRTDACLKKFQYNRDVKKKKKSQDSDVPTLSGEMPMKAYCRWYDLPFYNLQAFDMYSGRQQRITITSM